jgi:cyclophilin family peptidyl-prolyl cis-trans isomerase
MGSFLFKYLFWVLFLASFSLKADPHVDIITSQGTLTVQLNPNAAPITVANFLNYVDNQFYDNTLFHRIIKDFMVQGGGYNLDLSRKKTLPPIKLESNNGLFNQKGTIAMARTNTPDSATAQFFINTVDNNALNFSDTNAGYTVFGKITDGLELLEQMNLTETKVQEPLFQNLPVEPIILKTIRRREGQLKFTGLKTHYKAGETLSVSLEEFGIIREKSLDLWVAIILPNGQLLYLNQNANPFSTIPTVFKANVSPQETGQTVLNFTIPKGLAGDYIFLAIFNQPNENLDDLFHSLRSNLTQTQITLSD